MRYHLPVVLLLSLILLSSVTDAKETQKTDGSGAKQATEIAVVPTANETNKAGASATKQATEIEMVSVKGGCYKMGDAFGTGRSDEMPTHKICLDDFSIGKYEVTQAQWMAVMGNNPASNVACGQNCPVENVSWIDVQEFIKRLNGMTGKNYRLPSEAEWEYSARSGGKNELWAGTIDEAKLGDYAWFVDNSEEKTHPVGEKKPNGLGIYDMTGNVWEWCQDLHDDNYYKKSPVKNPQGPPRGQARVTRSGSWASKSWELRATARGRIFPENKNPGLGFRLVLSSAK